MNTRIANLLMLAAAVVFSYAVLLYGHVFPYLFMRAFSCKSLDEARLIMPDITRVTIDHAWVFALIIGLVCVISIALLRQIPDKALQVAAAGLCGQGIVAWIAMFCFSYDAFTGPMCLHHDSEFEFFTFLGFGAGVFPVTLVVILFPLIPVFFNRFLDKK